VLNGDGVDALHGREVLEDDGHVEVLDAELDSLKADDFDVIDVNDEEGELGDGDQAVLGGSHLHHTLVRAAIEIQIFNRYVKLDGLRATLGLPLGLLLDELHEVSEPVVQLDALLPLALFLLELVHVCEALPRDLVVKVIGRDARLLEELDILELLSADEDGGLEVEVDDHDQLIIPARLEEGMLDIRERNVYDVILLRDKSDTILMNLKVAHGLLSDNVGTNDKVLEHLLLTLDCLKDLDLTIACCTILRSRVLSGHFLVFNPFKQVLDLLGSSYKVVLTVDLGALILQSQLPNEESIGVLGLLRELKGCATRGVEVDAQIGPLALGLD
jgi:hypothetical protein